MAIYFRGVGGEQSVTINWNIPEGQRNKWYAAACYWPCRTIDRWIPYMKFQPTSFLLVFQEFVGYFSPFWPCKMYERDVIMADTAGNRKATSQRGIRFHENWSQRKFYCTQSADNQQNSIMTDTLDSLCDFRRYPLIRLPKLSSSPSTIGFVFAIK